MKKINLISHSLITFFAFINLSFATDADVLFEKLKNSAENYEVIGSVCEQAARIELAEKFPAPAYDVKTGIIYANQSRVIGELDVVVFDQVTKQAVLIAEVKCWHNLDSAHKKATEQRQRFMRNIELKRPLKFYAAGIHHANYLQKQFADCQDFISISQKGGAASGFDDSLENSYDELMLLRKRLIQCQRQGKCRPYHKI